MVKESGIQKTTVHLENVEIVKTEIVAKRREQVGSIVVRKVISLQNTLSTWINNFSIFSQGYHFFQN